MQVDNSLTYFVLLVVTFATALNLFLTLRGAAVQSAKRTRAPVGERVPAFVGRNLADGRRVASKELLGRSLALVFLSPACPKCREKIADLQEILPATKTVGLNFWIAGALQADDLSQFLAGSPLLDYAFDIDQRTRRILNPLHATPYYVFIDDQLIVRVSDYLGDENWRDFIEQMREAAVDREPESRPTTQGGA